MELLDNDDFLKAAADAFTGRALPDPLARPRWDQDDEEEETPPSFWEESVEFEAAPLRPMDVDPQQPHGVQVDTQQQASEAGVDPWAQAQERADTKFNAKRWFANQDNGYIDPSDLAPIGSGHMMRPDAAQAFKAMKRAARKAGVTLGITDSYRSYESQVELKARKPTLAATPGKSNHGWGLALDLDLSEDAYKWLRRHGKRYGFDQPMDYEPWHWEYNGGYKGVTRKKPAQGEQVTLAEKPARQVGASDLSKKAMPSGMSFRDAVVAFATEPMTSPTRPKASTRLMIDKDPETPEELKATARKLAKAYGWTGAQWRALEELVQRESSWNPQAVNPSSGAAGLPQRLPSAHPWDNKKDQRAWMNDPIKQLRWLMSYVDGRYGDPVAALRHHDSANWY